MATEVRALPNIPVNALTVAERALGRLLRVQLQSEPRGDAEVDLAGDAFFALYKASPELREDVPPERAVNRALLEWAQFTAGWEQSRAHTVANLPAALAAAGLLWSLLTTEDALQEALKKQEEAEEKVREAAALEAAAQGLQVAGMEDEAKNATSRAQRLRNEARVLAEAAMKEISQAQDDAMTRAAVAHAVRQAAKEAADVAQVMGGWGLGPGSDVRVDPRAALEFVRRNAAKFRRIAALAGRMRGVVLQARRERVAHGPIPAEAGLTRDLLRTFPTELALLHPNAPGVLRAKAIARWAEGGLLGWRLRGDEEKRGPFVAAVDVSGSMSGEREIVAKAVALGVAQVARAEGRKYILFTFGADDDPVYAVTSDQGWEEHLRWAEMSRGGGTSFNRALRETMKRLQEMNARGADALFISDGEARVADEVARAWRAFREATGARLLYVPVARGYGSIEALADQVIPLAELDEKAGEGLARQVAVWL